MREPSDADLRAVLIALVRRAGGEVEIRNTELYDAIMSDHAMRTGQFVVVETDDGIRLRIVQDEQTDPG
ncbi:MAG TPA: hypothetical protein VF054_08860 [Micromonosporaceae bacterium]